MKRIIAILLIAACVVSCKKTSTCYHCTFGMDTNGNIPEPQRYCGEDGASHLFKDSDGNNLSSVCVPE